MNSDRRSAELLDLLTRLERRFDRPADAAESRHLRALLSSPSGALQPRDRRTMEPLRILDAVLDSPLDIDSPVFERILSACENERFFAEPVRRKALQHCGRQQSRAAAQTLRTAGESAGTLRCNGSIPVANAPKSKGNCTIRGLHVRQAGHDFVLPIDKIERAVVSDVDKLPTVHGRAVAHFAGEMCDVVRLVGHLGLMARRDSSPGILIVVSVSESRICVAVDEVVGAVETNLTSLETILPRATGLVGVAFLDSGGLALVPDLSKLAR